MQNPRNYLLVLAILFFSQFITGQESGLLDYVRSPLHSLGDEIGHYKTLLAEKLGCTGYDADDLLKNSLSFLVALKHTITITGADWRVRFNFLLGLYNAYFIALDQTHRLWRVYIAQLSSHDRAELSSLIYKQNKKIDDLTYKAERMLKASNEQDDSWIAYEDLPKQEQSLADITFPFSLSNRTQVQAFVNYTSFKFLYDWQTVSTLFKGLFNGLMNLSKTFKQFQSNYMGIQNPISSGYLYAWMVKKGFNGYSSFFNNYPEFKVATSTLYPIWLAQIILEINCYKLGLDFFKLVYSIGTGFKYDYSYEEYLEEIEAASKELKWAKEEYAKIAPYDDLGDDDY